VTARIDERPILCRFNRFRQQGSLGDRLVALSLFSQRQRG
jgi:hypothetical protein